MNLQTFKDIALEGHPYRTVRRKLYANGVLKNPEHLAYQAYLRFPLINVGCGLDYIPGALNIDNRQVETWTTKRVDPDIVCDACAIPVSSGSYETALCLHIYEHQTKQHRFLGEMHRILKVGGRLILIVPNLEYMGERAYFRDPTHVLGCTARTMRFVARQYSKEFRVVQFNTLARRWKFAIDMILEKIC